MNQLIQLIELVIALWMGYYYPALGIILALFAVAGRVTR